MKGRITVTTRGASTPLPPSPAAAPASLQPTGAELSGFCHGRLCSCLWRNRSGSAPPLASKIPLKPAKIYEAQAVKKLGIRPGRISSDLWELRHGRNKLCSCPSLLSTQTAKGMSCRPLDVEGGSQSRGCWSWQVADQRGEGGRGRREPCMRENLSRQRVCWSHSRNLPFR